MVQGQERKLRIGIDSGGTFTDCIVDSGNGIEVIKVPSTPDDPARAILEVLCRYSPAEVIHGSTVATNALLERQYSRAAFITVAGFEDLLDIGRQNRPDIYDLQPSPPLPLIPREDRFGIAGRIGAGGQIVEDLDGGQLTGLADRLARQRYEAIAVGLLHSTENGEHEEAVRTQLASLGIPIVISREAAAEPREWERFTTATASAVLTPLMRDYLERLATGVEPATMKVMDSGGSVVPWQGIADRAVRTVLSGPAGGVVAASSRSTGTAAISFDMGGTSTDVALVDAGKGAARQHRFHIGGLPLAVPLLEVHTVGAGGGSLAWIDAGGALRVGPQSAGSDPGPAAYRRGGTGATVTDAHVVLGRLPDDIQLGETMSLDAEAALLAVRAVADELGLPVDTTACGIIEVVDAEMERALRRVSQERGVDPRGMTMVCFGGAGGLHAVSLARSCGIGEIRLPAAAGVLSAIGMLEAPWSEELEEVLLCPIDGDGQLRWREREKALAGQVREQISRSGGDAGAASVTTTLRARHAGQSHDLEFPCGENSEQEFRSEYQRRFGYRMDDRPVELVSMRVAATLPSPGISTIPPEPDLPSASCRVVAVAGEAPVEVPRVYHGSIVPGEPIEGPAVIVARTTTLWLPEGARLRADEDATLIIDPGRG